MNGDASARNMLDISCSDKFTFLIVLLGNRFLQERELPSTNIGGRDDLANKVLLALDNLGSKFSEFCDLFKLIESNRPSYKW